MTNIINFTSNPFADLDSIDRNDVTAEFAAQQRAEKLSLTADTVSASRGAAVADAVRSLISEGKLSFASTARSMRALVNAELTESRCA